MKDNRKGKRGEKITLREGHSCIKKKEENVSLILDRLKWQKSVSFQSGKERGAATELRGLNKKEA